MLGVVVQGRMYLYHFLVLVPPAALIYASVTRSGRLRPMVTGLLPFALVSIAWSGSHLRLAISSPPTPEVQAYLIAHTSPGEAVWMDHMERLLVESDRRPGSRYAHLFYFANYDQAPLEYVDRLLKDFEERRPALIALYDDIDERNVVAAGLVPGYAKRPVRCANFFEAWRRFKDYLAARYRPEAKVDGQVIYRRR